MHATMSGLYYAENHTKIEHTDPEIIVNFSDGQQNKIQMKNNISKFRLILLNHITYIKSFVIKILRIHQNE